jgi:hypothetical protein
MLVLLTFTPYFRFPSYTASEKCDTASTIETKSRLRS